MCIRDSLAGEVREHHHAVVSAILSYGVSEWRHLVGEVHHILDILSLIHIFTKQRVLRQRVISVM